MVPVKEENLRGGKKQFSSLTPDSQLVSSLRKGMPRVVGLEQKKRRVSKTQRLLSRGISGLCSFRPLRCNWGRRTVRQKLQAKRRPSQQHMRSMPSAHLLGKTEGGKWMSEWLVWGRGRRRECPLEWRCGGNFFYRGLEIKTETIKTPDCIKT